MTEAKFTPAPWFVGDDVAGDMEWNRHIYCNEEGRICFMAHTGGRGPDRDEANAHLIASAPELYEALEALVSQPGFEPEFYCNQCTNNTTHNNVLCAYHKAKAALKLARGEQVKP